MHVIELYQLTEWIDAQVRGEKILKKYQVLQSILKQNAAPNQPQQPFESQKDDLIAAIARVTLNRLSIDQLDFLRRLKIAPHVGEEGIADLEDNLYKHVIDIATSAANIQRIIDDINYGLEKSELIKKGLTDCVELGPAEFDEVLIRVSFSGQASLLNVADLKKWAGIWYEIARGITMAQDLSPEDVRIVGAKRGSIVLELAVVYAFALTTSRIIILALNVANRVLDIKKKAEEIRGLKLTNDNLAKEMQKAAAEEKAGGVEKIRKDIAAELKLNIETEGDKVTALNKAVADLVDFLEKGGEVDFVMPQEPESEETEEKETTQTRKRLRVAFEEIRKLEHSVKLLEHKKP
jgi:hypothetical protein